MRIHEINIRELVPILTGGPKGNYASIRPSGLVGSLRWLAEWVLYCTGRTESPFAKHTDCSGPHPVAEIFGSTDRRSRFDLLVDDTGIDFKNHSKRSPGRIGLQFVFRDAFDPESAFSSIVFLLKFAETYAGLGAKTSSGYGIFKVEDSEINSFQLSPMTTQVRNCLFGADISIDEDSSRNIGEQSINGYMLTSQKVRKKLRRLIDDKYIRHGFFGTFRGGWKMRQRNGQGPKRSVIRVSHLWKYNDGWKMRIWGFAKEDVSEEVGSIIDLVRNGEKNDDLARLISEGLAIKSDGITVRVFPEDFSRAVEGLRSNAES